MNYNLQDGIFSGNIHQYDVSSHMHLFVLFSHHSCMVFALHNYGNQNIRGIVDCLKLLSKRRRSLLNEGRISLLNEGRRSLLNEGGDLFWMREGYLFWMREEISFEWGKDISFEWGKDISFEWGKEISFEWGGDLIRKIITWIVPIKIVENGYLTNILSSITCIWSPFTMFFYSNPHFRWLII